MSGVGDRGRYDWLVELGGAIVPAGAVGFAGFRLAPLFGFAPAIAMSVASVAAFAIAYMAMRAVSAEPRQLEIADFTVSPIGLPDELLPDVRYEEFASPGEEPLEADDALLLDDALGDPGPESRLVRLFAPDVFSTAGQLRQRIDSHLATAPRPYLQPVPDASDALYQALAELRRSLR